MLETFHVCLIFGVQKCQYWRVLMNSVMVPNVFFTLLWQTQFWLSLCRWEPGCLVPFLIFCHLFCHIQKRSGTFLLNVGHLLVYLAWAVPLHCNRLPIYTRTHCTFVWYCLTDVNFKVFSVFPEKSNHLRQHNFFPHSHILPRMWWLDVLSGRTSLTVKAVFIMPFWVT